MSIIPKKRLNTQDKAEEKRLKGDPISVDQFAKDLGDILLYLKRDLAFRISSDNEIIKSRILEQPQQVPVNIQVFFRSNPLQCLLVLICDFHDCIFVRPYS